MKLNELEQQKIQWKFQAIYKINMLKNKVRKCLQLKVHNSFLIKI